MRDTILEILADCPTHGSGTIGAHASLCGNRDHRELAKALLEEECNIDIPGIRE